MQISPIAAPHSVTDTGIHRNILEDLALKNLYITGELSLYELAKNMGISLQVVEALFERMRKEQYCQVMGMEGGVHRISISSAGRAKATELLARNQYTGIAPVSLDNYINRVLDQSIRNIDISPDDLKAAFAELVLESKILNQLGAAVVSGQALFLHGPTGTGKSIVAQTLGRLFDSEWVWIPHAIEVDGEIITIFDPIMHQRIENNDVPGQDDRWVLCQRPRITVAGELTLDMVDLQLSRNTRFYNAPAQMKANNGLLIVDDFGRQRVKPETLLNRWIVPLERRVDALTFAGGKRIEVPFDLLVVFSTNLDPASMMEAAFLRRIQTKIEIGFVTPEQFHEIFRRVCRQQNVDYEHTIVEDLIRIIRTVYKEPLRACYPRDIVQQIAWSARYLRQAPLLSTEMVRLACENYFVPSKTVHTVTNSYAVPVVNEPAVFR